MIQKLDGSTMFNLREKTVVGFTIPKDKKLWIVSILALFFLGVLRSYLFTIGRIIGHIFILYSLLLL